MWYMGHQEDALARPRKDSIEVPTEDRLLGAAELAFGEKGFKATRLEDVAQLAGIRRPSLLYHFRSKEALYEAVLRRAFGQLQALVAEEMLRSGAPTDRVDRLLSGLLDFAAERQGVVAIILRTLVTPGEPGHALVAERVGAVVDGLQAALGEAPSGVPVRAAVLQIIAGYLVRVAAGPTGEALWAGPDETRALARALLVGGPR